MDAGGDRITCKSRIARVQGYKGSRAKGNGPGEAKAQEEVTEAGEEAVAKRRPAEPRIEVPATAAEHPDSLPWIFDPCPSIIGCSVIIIMPVILHPLPDIAVHVIKTPSVWRKFSHPDGTLSIFIRGTASIGIGAIEVRLIGGNAVSGGKWCTSLCAAGIFPLSLSGKTIFVCPLQTIQASDEFLSIVPTNFLHRAIVATVFEC